MDFVTILGGLGGGLALFLFGLGQLTGTLKQFAGAGAKRLLDVMTRNRVVGALTGAIATAIIQSSSVTTVLVVGFISAGLMTLSQAIGVIMGANVGSTVMAQIIAFNITAWALPIILVGFIMREFSKREGVQQSGTLIMGLGLIFLGMGAMSESTHPLRSYQPFLDVLAAMDNAALGIVAGAVFTALVQSSAATTGIAIAFAGQGLISLDAGIAIAFGANIGTCATAMLAAIGQPPAAKQAAWAHLLFNVLGVLIWLAFIPQLAELVRSISPDTGIAAADTPRQIANAHTIFNIINTVIFLPFTTQLAATVRRIAPDAPPAERIEPRFISDGLLETPALAIGAVHRELGHIGQLQVQLIDGLGDVEALDASERLASDIERVQGSLTGFLARIGHQELSDKESDELADAMSVTDYLSTVNDIVHGSLIPAERDVVQYAGFRAVADSTSLSGLGRGVAEQFRELILALQEWDAARAMRVIDEKQVVRKLADDTRAELRQLLREGDEKAGETYRLANQVIEHILRIYYLCKRIAKRIVQSQERMAA
ncbi:MAG: Na/Pi cotransporter family protein [Planctomycetota bacterium]|jgi:phosphate:Na+ symporter